MCFTSAISHLFPNSNYLQKISSNSLKIVGIAIAIILAAAAVGAHFYGANTLKTALIGGTGGVVFIITLSLTFLSRKQKQEVQTSSNVKVEEVGKDMKDLEDMVRNSRLSFSLQTDREYDLTQLEKYSTVQGDKEETSSPTPFIEEIDCFLKWNGRGHFQLQMLASIVDRDRNEPNKLKVFIDHLHTKNVILLKKLFEMPTLREPLMNALRTDDSMSLEEHLLALGIKQV